LLLACAGVAARARDGGAEQGEQPGGGNEVGRPGADDRAGELPGAGELVSLGPAQPEGSSCGDQVGDRRQVAQLGEGQPARHRRPLRPGTGRRPGGAARPQRAALITPEDSRLPGSVTGRAGWRGPCPRVEGAGYGGPGNIGEAEGAATGGAPQPGEGIGQIGAGAL